MFPTDVPEPHNSLPDHPTRSSQQSMFNSNQSSSSLTSYTTHHEDHRRRKRNRTMQSCLPCHTNKRRCNRGRPCERCIGLGITGNCVYETEDPKVLEKLDLKDPACEIQRLRERVAELEGVVRILKNRPHPKQQRSSHSSSVTGGPSSAGSRTPGPTSPAYSRTHSQSTGPWSPHESGGGSVMEMYRSPTSVSVDGSGPASPTFEHTTFHARPARSASFKDNFESLVVCTEDNHSTRSETVIRQSSCPPGMKGYAEDRNVIQDEEDGRKLFLGNAAGGSLLRKLQGLTSPDEKPHMLDSVITPPEKSELITAKVAYMGLFGGEIGKRWAFDMPGSISSVSDARKMLIEALPSPECARQLLDIFLEEVDCYYHAWHTPTVVETYERFFASTRYEQERCPPNKLSFIFSIVTVTVDLTTRILDDPGMNVGESPDQYRKRFKDWRSNFSNRLAACTVHCLKMASYLGHPSLECIQAQLLLVLYMVNNGRCTDAWCFIGGVIKQAQCLGLHIDPKKLNSDMSVFEQEMHRRIWWSVQTWDVLLGIAFGWPAGVTLSDSDLSADCTEESLTGGKPSFSSSGMQSHGVTELTYHVFNWETCLYARLMMDRIFGQSIRTWDRSTSSQDGPNYQDVVLLDDTLKKWYRRVPPVMRFEPDPMENHLSQGSGQGTNYQSPSPIFQPSSAGVGVEDIRRRDRKLAKQSLMLSISANTILLLLHRPFISHSLENATRVAGHLRSEEQCIRSSQVIIEAQRLLVELFPATRRMWYGWYQTFHAAMTCAWISLLRTPNHALSGVSRKCIQLAIETFELARDAPESMPDTHFNACSQLRAIQRHIDCRLNPHKRMTHTGHIYGPVALSSAYPYGMGAHPMTRLATDFERVDSTFAGSSAGMNTAGDQESSSLKSFAFRPRPAMAFPASYPIHSHYSPTESDPTGGLSQSSSSIPSEPDVQLRSQVHRASNLGANQHSTPISRFNSTVEPENSDRQEMCLESSASASSQRPSPLQTEAKAAVGSRNLNPLDPYPSIDQLTHSQLPSIHGFMSPGAGMGFCGSTSSTSAPAFYASQYAMGSLPFQDVSMPFSVLLMQDANGGADHGGDVGRYNERFDLR